MLAQCGIEDAKESFSAPALALAPGRAKPRSIPSSAQLDYEPHEALLDGNRKYVLSRSTGVEIAFDLALDAAELAPIVDEHSLGPLREVALATAAAANELREELDLEARSAEIDGRNAETLRALGYIGR